MSKKQIIILVIVFVLVALISTISIYLLLNPKNKSTSNDLKVGNYTLTYGKYKGTETEYDNNTNKVISKEIKIELTKDKINNEDYIVKGESLYVNGFELYKVVSNNKILLLAGEGVEFIYEGK